MAISLRGADQSVTESIHLEQGRYVVSIASLPSNDGSDITMYGPADFEESFTLGKAGKASAVVKLVHSGNYFFATDSYFEGPWTVGVEPR
jgi:hypothetical protein